MSRSIRLELKNDSPFIPEDQNSVKIYDSKIGLIKEAKIGSIVEIDIYQYPTKLYFYLEGFPVTEFILKDKQSDQPISIVINKSNELNEVVLNSERKKFLTLQDLVILKEPQFMLEKNRSNSGWTINCKFSL